MNADTRSPHLDLEDLIAGAAGQPLGDQAGQHLARCEHCQREASRWNLVADGVRGLAAAVPPTAPTTPMARPARTARTARTRRPGRHGPADTRPASAWRPMSARRRVLLAAGGVAAALVLLIGVGTATGLVHLHLSGPGSETTLTAVTGCSQLQQAAGTLEQVNRGSLVIKTASGRPVTVTTTATTFVSSSGAQLSDITDGASVQVRGSSSGGTIAAAIVTVGQPFSAVNPAGFVPVTGTVADAGAAGFTLVTPGGTRVPVTTSGATLVVVPHASPAQLQPGTAIIAIGHAGPDGTLAATAVAALSPLPSGPRLSVSVKDCSASSVDEALGALSAAAVTAG